MTENRITQPINWHLPEISAKAELQKMIKSFHEEEATQNKNRLLYPPDVVGTVTQLHYSSERRDRR